MGGRLSEQGGVVETEGNSHIQYSCYERDRSFASTVLPVGSRAATGPRPFRNREGFRFRSDTRHRLYACVAGLFPRSHFGVPAGTAVAEVSVHHLHRHVLRGYHSRR